VRMMSGVVARWMVNMLFVVFVAVAACGSFEGCAGKYDSNKQHGPSGGAVEVALKHQVTPRPRSLVVTGEKVYFVGRNGGYRSVIEVSLPDGKERVLVDGVAEDIAVSSDGRFLAYATESQWGEPCEVFMIDLEKGDSRKLTDTTGPLRGMDFSPSGDSLAFASLEGLMVIGIGGANRKVLMEGKTNGESTVVPWQPTWSPDGTKIAYAVTYYEGSGPVRIVDVRTGAVTEVTKGDDVDPLWSPDGKFILYTHAVYGEEGSDVYIVDLGNEQATPKRITGEKERSWGLGWSPDGFFILVERTRAFGENSGSAVELLAYEVTEDRFHELSVTGVQSMAATWASDGSIYYVTEDGKLTRVGIK